MLHSVSRTILRTKQGRGLVGEKLQAVLWLQICFARQTFTGAELTLHRQSLFSHFQSFTCPVLLVSVEVVFFPGSLLSFKTNAVRLMEATDHLQLAPCDPQHKVSVSMWALLAFHASRFAASSRHGVDAEAVEKGLPSRLPTLCVTSGFGLWSALHPVFLCLCLPLILCFSLLPFIQVGKFLHLLLHIAWLPAEMLRALESFLLCVLMCLVP